MQDKHCVDQYINDKRNEAMMGFVMKKCVPGFYGNLTLKIQDGVIEGVKIEDYITKATVEGRNHADRHSGKM